MLEMYSAHLNMTFNCLICLGGLETHRMGHCTSADIRTDCVAMGIWTECFPVLGRESHDFSRLHGRRIEFRLRLFGDGCQHLRCSFGHHFRVQGIYSMPHIKYLSFKFLLCLYRSCRSSFSSVFSSISSTITVPCNGSFRR